MNNIYEDRCKSIGHRIAEERKHLKNKEGKSYTQEELAGRINDILGTESVSQSSISQWEKGKTFPPLDRLLILSQIFGCDCAYLLCDYDSRTHDNASISQRIGLSENSIDFLASNQQWGINLEAKILDFLILDAKERPKSHHYRSILDLLAFFFRYKDHANTHKEVCVNGSIKDGSSNGFISPGAIALDQRIIENAVLNEITRALISLKENLKKEEGENNG